MNAYERLSKEYGKAVAELRKEENTVQAHLKQLEKRKESEEVINAKVNHYLREGEDALVVGNSSLYYSKKEQAEKIKTDFENLVTEIKDTETKLEGVRRQMRLVAGQTLSSLFPEIQKSCFQALEEYLQRMEETYQALKTFAGENNIPGLKNYTLRLVPSPLGEERPLRARVAEWF